MLPRSVDFLRIDINSGKVRKSVSVCQSDTVQRTLSFSLVNSGTPIDMTGLLFAEILINKANGYEADNGCVIDGNQIEYTLRSTDIQALGINICQLMLTFDTGEVITTPTFEIVVYQKVLDQRVQESTNEYGAITQQLVQVNSLASNAAVSADSAAASASEAASYVGAVSEYANSAASEAVNAQDFASLAQNYANSAESAADVAASETKEELSSTFISYKSEASSYVNSASYYASEAASEAAVVSNLESSASEYAASASEYALTASSEATVAAGYISSTSEYMYSASAYASTAGSQASNAAAQAGSASTIASEMASEAANYLTSTSEYASSASEYASTASSEAVEADASADLALTYAVRAEEAYEKMGEEQLVLGETSSTAYRGDRGKAAYEHSQVTGNPHNTTYSDVGADQLGAAAQALLDAKSYVDTAIANLINSAPSTLDTLGEIADAMATQASVVEALDLAIGSKATASDLTTHTGNTTVHITAAERTKWDGITDLTTRVAALEGKIGYPGINA